MSQRIELIAEALPVIERIGTLEQEGRIAPEQAELLRRKVLSGAGMFIEAGAIIPEIQERSHFNVRSLMAPEPRLLSSAPPEVELYPEEPTSHPPELDYRRAMVGPSDLSIETLEEDERAELLRLLKKADRSTSHPSDHDEQ